MAPDGSCSYLRVNGQCFLVSSQTSFWVPGLLPRVGFLDCFISILPFQNGNPGCFHLFLLFVSASSLGTWVSNISLEAVTKATYLCRFWVCVCVWWILMALWMGLTADTPKTCTLQRPSDTYDSSCVPWSVPIVDTVPACSRYSVIICWMNTQDLTYYICTVQYSSHQPTWWFKLRCAVSNGHWILRLNAKKMVKKSS